jgi:hypothetical protein
VVAAILRALVQAVRRDLAGFGPLRTNNFFLFVFLLVWGAARSGVEPASAYPFLALLAAMVLFPVSSDPLEKIPRVRLALWPLDRRQRMRLRLAALALSPVVWLAMALVAWAGRSVLLPLGALTAAVVLRAAAPRAAPRFVIGRAVPRLPGADGILVALHLRAMLTALDTWLATAIAALGAGFRIAAPDADPASGRILAILVGIALSTLAQCSSGLEATRYRLLPAAGWRVILARDAAFLLVLALLTAALDPRTGLVFGMAALAAGRYPSLHSRLRVERWRFAGGRVLFGVLQMIGGGVLAFGGSAGALIAVAAWGLSVLWGSHSWLRTRFPAGPAG